MLLVRRALAPLLLLAAPGLLSAGRPEHDILALQDVVQKAIARAEPGIACVLVSPAPTLAALMGLDAALSIASLTSTSEPFGTWQYAHSVCAPSGARVRSIRLCCATSTYGRRG